VRRSGRDAGRHAVAAVGSVAVDPGVRGVAVEAARPSHSQPLVWVAEVGGRVEVGMLDGVSDSGSSVALVVARSVGSATESTSPGGKTSRGATAPAPHLAVARSPGQNVCSSLIRRHRSVQQTRLISFPACWCQFLEKSLALGNLAPTGALYERSLPLLVPFC